MTADTTYGRLLQLSERAVGALLDASEQTRSEIITRIAVLCEEEVERERKRCVDACRERAEKWRRTPSASSDIPGAREEARARANEAQYLADLIESGETLPDPPNES